MSKNVSRAVRKAILGGMTDPQLSEVLGYFFQAAGGARAIGKILYEEFCEAKQGGMMRQRILEMILRRLKYANEQQGSRDNLGLASDADLEQDLKALLGEIAVIEGDDEDEGEQGHGEPAGAE